MTANLKILVLEDNQNDADLLHRELKKSGLSFTSEIVKTRTEFENSLQNFNPDIILSDYSLPSFDAGTAFRIKQNTSPHIPFIIVSGIIGEENAVELIKDGVTDYTPKNKLFTLSQKISRALTDMEERKEKNVIAEKLKIQAAELMAANKELVFKNAEKEQLAAELVKANKELVFQNEEKEKRAAELIIANKELLAFTYISSHDLQEPLRKIQTFASAILEKENGNLSESGKFKFQRMQLAAGKMQQLIHDLLAYSRISTTELKFEKTDLNTIVEEIKIELKDTIQEKQATIEAIDLCSAPIIAFQFRQLMYNLISNALKFSNPDIPPRITIKSQIVKGSKLINEKLSPEKTYCYTTVQDNGIGFEPHFSERIFGLFQKLHSNEVYGGTGIGLAIVKKIVENHNGIIFATSELTKGTTFHIYIPEK